jgi:hypothetical protein
VARQPQPTSLRPATIGSGRVRQAAPVTSTPHIRNLTPHDVVVQRPDGQVRIPSEGVARVLDRARDDSAIDGVPIVALSTGGVVGLPEPEPGVLLLVSRVLALAVTDRTDLVFPFGEIRDDSGRILAVAALARWSSQSH